jgi:xanthine/CO dehydrogenase XdhC/CoxF family maturation factor
MLGAGPDAEPVARLARQLCWRVTIADHREAWVRPDRFPAGCDVRGVTPESLADSVDLASVSAAVIMSHSFTADEAYLRSMATAPPSYVGLLGPAARRDALLAALGDTQRARLADRTRGPVGLNLGGRSPQAIALSLIAEIQAVLSGRDGRPLDERLRAGADRRAAG